MAIVLAVLALLLSAACQDTAKDAIRSASSPSPAPPATIAVTPKDAATGVAPDQPVTVSADHGTLSNVTVTDAKGAPVKGALNADATTWTSSGRLALSTKYSVEATAVNGDDKPKTLSSTFTTVTPKATTYPSVIPLDGETVGVGMVIHIFFSHPVGDKAAAERLLKVTSQKPVEGAWHWFGDDEVHYRPKTYWPPYDKVTLDINIGDRDLGGGVYGETSRQINFQTGASMITKVSNATKSLKTYRNGKLVKTAPVSLGKPSTPSSSGTLLVMTVQHPYTMNSATFGVPPDSPGGYKTTVDYALRLTNGGEFLHSAPWSVRQQGHVNVSHGCINVSTSVAKWFYENSHRGDVVIVSGTERQVRPGDGWTDWRFGWPAWTAGSALS